MLQPALYVIIYRDTHRTASNRPLPYEEAAQTHPSAPKHSPNESLQD